MSGCLVTYAQRLMGERRGGWFVLEVSDVHTSLSGIERVDGWLLALDNPEHI